MSERKPIVLFIAGPNGAGKSTLYERAIKPKFIAPFINADVIQKEEMKDPSVQASYEAAQIAEKRRQEHLSEKKSFVTESVFSHPSKLDVIREANKQGFTTAVYHVNVAYPSLSVERVKGRVKNGGHSVPEDKIRERYERNQPLIKEAIKIADKGFVYDNSKRGQDPALIMQFEQGKVKEIAENVPKWARDLYKEELKPYSLSRQSPGAASYRDLNNISKHLGDKDTKLEIAKAGKVYAGKIIGETDLQVLQKGKNNTNIAHFKSNLDTALKQESEVAILYIKKNKAISVELLNKQGGVLSKEEVQASLEKKNISKKIAANLNERFEPARLSTELSKRKSNKRKDSVEPEKPDIEPER